MAVTAPSILDLHASATTTDGKITGEISGRYDVRYTFAPRYYNVASAEDIAWQLEELHPRLFRARMAEFYRIRSLQDGHLVREPAPKPERADYDAAREEVLAVGEAMGGAIRMTAVGLKTWTVTIAPSARNGLEEHGMTVALGRAATALVTDEYRKIAQLKLQFFGDR